MERCPFSPITNTTGIEFQKTIFTKEVKHAVQRCPAFKTKDVSSNSEASCPFKGGEDMEKTFKSIPHDHFFGESKSREVLQSAIQQIHSNVTEEKDPETVGAECPFKSVTLDGQYLVEALKWRVWPGVDEVKPEEETTGPTLSQILHSSTQESHELAREVQFVKLLVKGSVSQDQYVHLVALLYHVYVTLEMALHEAFEEGNAPVMALHMPVELNRVPGIEEDLEYYLGDEWKRCCEKVLSQSSVLQSYIRRIRYVADKRPELLVAHAYTRYLADLSGGRILRRSLCRAFNLPKDGSGVQYFEFPNINKSANQFKKDWKAKLDALHPPPQIATDLVQEALIAYNHNIELLRSLDEVYGLSVAETADLGSEPETTHRERETKVASTCPFHVMEGTLMNSKESSWKMEWFHVMLMLCCFLIPCAFPSEVWMWWT